jgi:hypothetical protein
MQTTSNETNRTYAVRSLVVLGFIAAAATLACATTNAARAVDDELSSEQNVGEGGDQSRMREGTKVEKLAGYFKLTGDRVTFYPAEGKQHFGGLENLALERIARTVKDSPSQLNWIITGTITEYRGSNYLLVTHAVLKDEQKSYAKQ